MKWNFHILSGCALSPRLFHKICLETEKNKEKKIKSFRLVVFLRGKSQMRWNKKPNERVFFGECKNQTSTRSGPDWLFLINVWLEKLFIYIILKLFFFLFSPKTWPIRQQQQRQCSKWTQAESKTEHRKRRTAIFKCAFSAIWTRERRWWNMKSDRSMHIHSNFNDTCFVLWQAKKKTSPAGSPNVFWITKYSVSFIRWCVLLIIIFIFYYSCITYLC